MNAGIFVAAIGAGFMFLPLCLIGKASKENQKKLLGLILIGAVIMIAGMSLIVTAQ